MTATKLEVLKEMKVMLEESTEHQFLCHLVYWAISKLDGGSVWQASNTNMYSEITEHITKRISGEPTVETYVEKCIGKEKYYPERFPVWVSHLRHRILDEMIAAEEAKQKAKVHPYATEIIILENAKEALKFHTFLCNAVKEMAWQHYHLFTDDPKVLAIREKISQEIAGVATMEGYFEVKYGFVPSDQNMLTARMKLADKLIAQYKEMK